MGELRFICPCCGLEHQGLPDLAYPSPGCWDVEAAAREPRLERLGWGAWVSQSEADFQAYVSSFEDTPERETFGYLSNSLPHYPDTYGLRALVHWQRGRRRPLVELEPVEHPLVDDWRDGVILERAIEFAAPVLHPGAPEADPPRVD